MMVLDAFKNTALQPYTSIYLIVKFIQVGKSIVNKLYYQNTIKNLNLPYKYLSIIHNPCVIRYDFVNIQKL